MGTSSSKDNKLDAAKNNDSRDESVKRPKRNSEGKTSSKAFLVDQKILKEYTSHIVKSEVNHSKASAKLDFFDPVVEVADKVLARVYPHEHQD